MTRCRACLGLAGRPCMSTAEDLGRGVRDELRECACASTCVRRDPADRCWCSDPGPAVITRSGGGTSTVADLDHPGRVASEVGRGYPRVQHGAVAERYLDLHRSVCPAV